MRAMTVQGRSCAVLLLLCFLACGGPGSPVATPTPMAERNLPPPRLQGEISLEESLAQRRSIRAYADRALSWEEICQLLWAAQGVTDPRGFRTAPSAGALYPLEVYLILPQGWYHYRPQGHLLEQRGEDDLREGIWRAGLEQDWLRQAPAVFVITGVVSRTAAKYGARAERYVHLEAGHAAQNLLLQATALGLGGVSVGAFHDDQVRTILGLPDAETPLYLIPVGEPSPSDSGD